MVARLSLLGAVLVGAALFACSSLKSADSAPDGGGSLDDSGTPPANEDGSSPDGGSLPDGAVPDAGTPPVDFECATDPWTRIVKAKPECAPRQVKVVDATAPAAPTGVSIARTTKGRVGIVYNAEQGSETGELHLVHFTPTTATYPAPKLVKRATGFAFHDGYRTKLAAIGPDTLAVLSFDMDDNNRAGEVHLRKLVAGAEPLTDDLAMTGVADPTEIAVAVDAAGVVYATARVSTGATTAKLSARTKTATGTFTSLPDVYNAFLPKQAPGLGATSLFVDPNNQLHLLFHQNEVMQHSTPRYHSLDGTLWSYRKTIDNAVVDGLSGYSPRIATFGTKKYAAFFFRKALQGNPVTADLRLASWDAAADVPVIQIVDQGIPSVDPLYPEYRVALAVDKFGLVHLAIVRPTSGTTGYLEYRRQTRVSGGGTKWLSDIVDPDVVSNLSSAFVDLVVDENARPHIAYRSARDGLVKYATRFDR